jgi:hypothetical protein
MSGQPHYIKIDGKLYADWQRSRPHTCIYHEYNLTTYVRCRICGHLRLKEEVPYYASFSSTDQSK